MMGVVVCCFVFGGSSCVLCVFGYSCSDVVEGKVICSGYRFLISSVLSFVIVMVSKQVSMQ